MAVVECIPEKKQTPSAQKGVIDYCIQPSKTYDDDEQLAYVSGYNCIPELANESFLATQKVFGHEPDRVRFYHYVQSFRIGEEITPHEAHEIGMEFAESFGNREVLVATHIDREHIHNTWLCVLMTSKAASSCTTTSFFSANFAIGAMRFAWRTDCRCLRNTIRGRNPPVPIRRNIAPL